VQGEVVDVVPLNTSYVGLAGADVLGNRVYPNSGLRTSFVCADGLDGLYFTIVVRNAYVPISGEVFRVIVTVVQD